MKATQWRLGNPGSSELILRNDGPVYHLGVLPEDIADTVLVVGDPERVGQISSKFDSIQVRKQSREFAVHTGSLNNTRLTVLSTGIGVDNIDIVINELDAAVNIDLKTGGVKRDLRILKIIRLGTSGSLQPDLPAGTILLSKAALGIDGLPYHYRLEHEKEDLTLIQRFVEHMDWDERLAHPYLAWADESLIQSCFSDFETGLTYTANGFYGPQGRSLRLANSKEDHIQRLSEFKYGELRLTNIEMECAGLYALGGALGHKMVTCCVLLAERKKNAFISDPQKAIDRMIAEVLQRLT
jgi:uridine phosphorylase